MERLLCCVVGDFALYCLSKLNMCGVTIVDGWLTGPTTHCKSVLWMSGCHYDLTEVYSHGRVLLRAGAGSCDPLDCTRFNCSMRCSKCRLPYDSCTAASAGCQMTVVLRFQCGLARAYSHHVTAAFMHCTSTGCYMHCKLKASKIHPTMPGSLPGCKSRLRCTCTCTCTCAVVCHHGASFAS